MIGILNQLKEVGVHSIISDEQIFLEILEDNLNQAKKIDGLINDLLTEMESSNFKKVLLECLSIHLRRLNCTVDKMKSYIYKVSKKSNKYWDFRLRIMVNY
ncbi:hypothetical protein [Oceanobacillus indicireducens]|uniref:Uncharacterized protein n=1 Tax=Oceanobacillus indicireducens TaxID=1004261 RepID=A0A918D2E3_9BACI|nr:hypothetical protein [Oceanobacillus indicireducens]GGN59115.1 hypothetical protein GCM10007971_21880 [Oceanobacillus indicireducens]